MSKFNLLKVSPKLLESKQYLQYSQQRFNSCGPTSLRIALSWYWLYFDEDHLCDLSGLTLSKIWTSPTDLALAVQLLGGHSIIKYNGELKDLIQFKKNNYHIIIWNSTWKSKVWHYSLLYDLNTETDKLYIIDPLWGALKEYKLSHFIKYRWKLWSHKDGDKVFLAFKL